MQPKLSQSFTKAVLMNDWDITLRYHFDLHSVGIVNLPSSFNARLALTEEATKSDECNINLSWITSRSWNAIWLKSNKHLRRHISFSRCTNYTGCNEYYIILNKQYSQFNSTKPVRNLTVKKTLKYYKITKYFETLLSICLFYRPPVVA